MATLRGAAQYGLARRPLVSSIVSPKAYLMKAKLPAEEQDHLMRPAYITYSESGAPLCENRYVKVYSSFRCSDYLGLRRHLDDQNCRENACARPTLVLLQIQRG